VRLYARGRKGAGSLTQSLLDEAMQEEEAIEAAQEAARARAAEARAAKLGDAAGDASAGDNAGDAAKMLDTEGASTGAAGTSTQKDGEDTPKDAEGRETVDGEASAEAAATAGLDAKVKAAADADDADEEGVAATGAEATAGEAARSSFTQSIAARLPPAVRNNPALQVAFGLPLTVLAGTFLWSVGKVVRHKLSPRTRRKRLVARNLGVIEKLNKYLPTRREELTPQLVRAVRSQSGFSAEEVFRKYLRYVLDQRPFDTNAVADIVALRDAAGLNTETTSRALEELSRRMYQSYGALMLKTDGMGASGAQRKVTGRNYFRKIMYLCELKEVLPQASENGDGDSSESTLFGRKQLQDMFGATDDDVEEVRMTKEDVVAADV